MFKKKKKKKILPLTSPLQELHLANENHTSRNRTCAVTISCFRYTIIMTKRIHSNITKVSTNTLSLAESKN